MDILIIFLCAQQILTRIIQQIYGTDHEMYFQEIENEEKLEEFLDRFMTQEEFLETVKEYLIGKMTE
ncbi:hypothetical protein REB14_00365 [Chryseobacterium sp. ES2]|uniref:Uncharacterized protein n=1 Tax=Chryseobacterium metallicongregator TaxID=3073042 RepID=A0ABU1DYL2_9FLAO|nr:hypothetical protein [Chryseobacterium sp. ES2]MDR4950629.1 hypothetical protein [Chryseobacterium sp. ES2]